MRYKWGIDLGGTKIEGVILDTEKNNEIVDRLRLPTERDSGYQHVLGQIQKVIVQLSQNTGLVPSHIGIGTPGIIDPSTSLLKNSNTVCLNGQPFLNDLEDLLRLEIKSSNDANCFAIAETNMGVVTDMEIAPKIVFGVILGTGVGGGLVINGEIINGLHGIGGEWGHNVLEQDGRPCYCGKKGCVEQVISGPALEAFYKERSGNRCSLKEISERDLEGNDDAASETIERLLKHFGKGISQIINTIDPEVILLGGGVGNIAKLHSKAAEYVLPHIFNDKVETSFLKPALGDSAGVFGAALLW